MDNTLTGLQKITDRILADAKTSAEDILGEARAEAEKYRADVRKDAEAKAAEIRAKANERAAAILENAASGAEAKARGERLYVKNEYAEKAAQLAKDRFISFSDEEKIPAYATLLANAVNTCVPDGAKATMSVNEKDAALAPRVIEAARPAFKKAVEIGVSDTFISDKAGFLLRFGDIEVRCVEDTLFGELDGNLKKSVLSLLFAE